MGSSALSGSVQGSTGPHALPAPHTYGTLLSGLSNAPYIPPVTRTALLPECPAFSLAKSLIRVKLTCLLIIQPPPAPAALGTLDVSSSPRTC